MGTFKTAKFIPISIPLGLVVKDLETHFTTRGFTVQTAGSGAGSHRVSIAKGGAFRSVLGLKTALHIDLEPGETGTQVTASVGILGQQAVPTFLTLLVAWPVALTQVWGMVQQAKLDDEAVQVAEVSLRDHQNRGSLFCPECGAPVPIASPYCGQCGHRQPERTHP